MESLLDEYLNYQETHEKFYGKDKTLVFMEVGTFYESYCTDVRGHQHLATLAPLLNNTFTRKNTKIPTLSAKNPGLLGINSVSKEKNITLLMELGYTIILYCQVPEKKQKGGRMPHVLEAIYTPATYMKPLDILQSDTQNIMSIYLEEEGKILCCGISIIDLSIGKSIVHETYSKKEDVYYALDELARFITTHSPKEIIIVVKNIISEKFNTEDKIIKYLEISDISYRYFDTSKIDSEIKEKYIYEELWKVNYQNTFFTSIFPWIGKNKLSAIEQLDLVKKQFATVSYIILLNFIYRGDSKLLDKLDAPLIYDDGQVLLLGNNAAQQLNIIDSDAKNIKIKFKSLFDVVNKTSTVMGKRFLKYNLMNPLTNVKELRKRYHIIDYLAQDDFHMGAIFESYMQGINDLERFHQRISQKKLNPCDLFRLYKSYENIKLIVTTLRSDEYLMSAFLSSFSEDLIGKISEFSDRCVADFNLDEMEKYTLLNISASFFNEGNHSVIDALQQDIGKLQRKMGKISADVCKYVGKKAAVKIEYNSNYKYHIQLTKTRYTILEKAVKTSDVIDWDKVEYNPVSAKKDSKMRLDIPELEIISTKLENSQTDIIPTIKNAYIETLDNYYQEFHEMFKMSVELISQLDFFISGAKCANLYNYVKPIIKKECKDDNLVSYVDCKQIRHPIIERINIDTEYIPHDLKIGLPDEIQGMVIYGVNASGKSSLQKTLGSLIILAQIGYFVPATEWIYYPYKALFTRISANDNILKGLSSFALEMYEVDSILKRTEIMGQNTLVIGDEICRGTEMLSAISIVAAMILKLVKNKSSFIFTSHLHEIAHMKIITDIKNVSIHHLKVDYDKSKDCLIYHRTLENGSGPSDYGSLVAKYLVRNDEFIKSVEEIKKSITGIDKIVSTKTSKYNSKIYVDTCQICGRNPKISGEYKECFDTHHIKFQRNCDKKGFIIEKPHIHKNHKCNLIILCKKCHQAVHDDKIIIEGYLQTLGEKIVNYREI